MKDRKKMFFIIIAAVVITGLLFLSYVFSKIRSIHAIRASIEKAELERVKSESKDAVGAADMKKSVPLKGWTAEFIETAYNVSLKHGIKKLTFEQKSAESHYRQAPGAGKQAFVPYPVRMTFQCAYREMAEFIHELQDMDRLVTVETVKVKRDNSFLSVDMTVNTYAMEGK